MTERRAFLDGLRGWAALMVLFGHSTLQLLGISHVYSYSPYWFLANADFAVQVFFVLSGFALSTRYFQTRQLEPLRLLVLRRYLRLTIPILLTSSLYYLAMKAGLMYNQQSEAFPSNSWVKLFYNFEPSLPSLLSFSLMDVYLTRHEDFVNSYNSNLWTMMPEFWGSLMIFVILIATAHYRRRWVIYTVLFFGIFYIENFLLPYEKFPNWQTMHPFLFGIILADWFERERFQRLRGSEKGYVWGLVLIAIGIVTSTYLPIVITQFVPISAACIVLGVAVSARISGWFETKLSRFLGYISFSLYLLQLLVLCSLSAYLYTQLEANGAPKPASQAITIVVSMGLAILAAWLFAPVEHKSQRWANRIARRVVGRKEMVGTVGIEPTTR